MKHQIFNFLNLTSPFLMALICIVLALVIAVAPAQIQIYIPIAGPFLALQGTLADPRLILLLVALIFLAIPAFRNYQNLYPAHMKFHVFFDADGLEASLRKLSKAEFEMLKIEENWRKMRYYQLYLDGLNTLVRELRLPNYAEFNETTHADGEVIVHVRRTQGWQKYQIEEMKGFMQFNFADKRGHTTILRDDFELLPTKANLLAGSLREIYISWTKIIQPSFAHYVHVSPTRRFHAESMQVIGVTKLRFFPILDPGRTVYFVEDTFLLKKQSDPKLIPVCYAEYYYD